MNVLEFLFQDIPEQMSIALLRFLGNNEDNLVAVNSTIPNCHVPKLFSPSLFAFLATNDDFSMAYHTKLLILANCQLKGEALLLFKERGVVDVRLLVDVQNFIDNSCCPSIKDLHKWCEKISLQFNVSHYYCGYDPVDDRDMQFFTDKGQGELYDIDFIDNYYKYLKASLTN
ncbi:hypothetical protein [Desulfovibrio litoralis]|uniref:Uncharacterized protein n=1 Tax=Desulfovibrio litoralis DSM 11393 TaxID=1121455 RepID=A0A1M7TH19_9BACT|nr:hypothetical protein [Desulfovibrio litoralis]SHN70000.1 hypothetical protein SAMN02745728_01986 [Desulfovibrio litoralis DSM 11393]